jgi:NitT/TauT family transport system substrate-binding protein
MRMNAMFGVVGVAVAMFAATAAFADPVKVAVGYVTATDFTPVFVAKEKGIFAKHDLDVDPKRIPIIVNIPAALMTGDLQIGAATMPLLLQSADGGLDMQLVSGGARHLQSNSKIALMVRTGLKIEKPEDLKGKKIGVAGFNSTMDVFLRKWLRVKGLGDNDVTRVEANFPQMPDLLKAGTVDAVTITDPLRSIAVKQGVGYVYADYAAELLPDVLMIGYISNGEWAKKNTAAIKNFKVSLDEAVDYINAHPDEIGPIEQKYLGFTSPSKSNWSTTINSGDLDPYIAIGKEFGLYKTALDPAKLIVK